MHNITTADLCEEAHERLSIDEPYVEGGDTYTDEAQRWFEYHLSELEQDLCDKGYQFNRDTSEWEPTRFYIGDPSLILGEERFQGMLRGLSPGESRGRAYINEAHEIPVMWAYTVAGDGVFLVYNDKDEHIGEVTVDSGMIAFIPQDLADKDTVEKAMKEEHVLPPRALNIDKFSFSEENGSIILGDIWVNVKW